MENNGRSKQLLKGTGIYAIGSFGTKILSFIIVPLYTYYIATSDMGVYDILMSTISLLTPIITMQISDAAYKMIITDKKNQSKYVTTTMQVLFVNCIIASIIILIINYFYTIPYCIYFCVLLVFSRILETTQKLLRGLKKQWLFAISGIIYTTIYLLLNLLLLCIFHRGVTSLFQSAIIANIITMCIILIAEKDLRINIFKSLDLELITSMYKFSIPLVPNYLNWWIINSSDRFITLYFLGASATGLLAIANKFPTMLQSIIGLFNSSWQDLAIADKRSNDNYYSIVFEKYYQFALTFLIVLIPITKIFIIIVMNTDYKVACNYVPFYYLGTVFQGFSSFVGVGYMKNGNTKKAFSSSIYGAIINAVLNLLLINYIGIQAASVSTFIAFFVMWTIRMRQTKYDLEIKLQYKKFGKLLILAIVFSILSIVLPSLWNIFLAMVGICGFLYINKKDIAYVFTFFKNKFILS